MDPYTRRNLYPINIYSNPTVNSTLVSPRPSRKLGHTDHIHVLFSLSVYDRLSYSVFLPPSPPSLRRRWFLSVPDGPMWSRPSLSDRDGSGPKV